MTDTPLLRVSDLCVSFRTPDGVVRAVDSVSFDVHAGETVGIVGESGSGKSVTANALMRLNFGAQVSTTGSILLDGVDLGSLSEEEMRLRRGRDIAMVFQDPLSALNPFYSVGDQVAEAYRVHHPKARRPEMRDVVVESLGRVGIPEPIKRMQSFPHEFSGGMRQRIVIAMALVNSPRLLIADEPTTALDVTVQAQILELIQRIQQESGTAVLLITHDLGVIAETTERVIVMYGGRVVEEASVESVFEQPTHPYTLGLLGSVRSLDSAGRGSLRAIPGSPPSLIHLPTGCAFRPRCRFELGEGSPCGTTVPTLSVAGHSRSACHLDVTERERLIAGVDG
ncbi:MAG: ABC transporter ATP-binding protein [Actinomycetota bacterium]